MYRLSRSTSLNGPFTWSRFVTSPALFLQELERVVGVLYTKWGLGYGQTPKPFFDTKQSDNPLKSWSLFDRKKPINSQFYRLIFIYQESKCQYPSVVTLWVEPEAPGTWFFL